MLRKRETQRAAEMQRDTPHSRPQGEPNLTEPERGQRSAVWGKVRKAGRSGSKNKYMTWRNCN